MTIVQGGYVRRISTGKELKTVVQVRRREVFSVNLKFFFQFFRGFC